MRDFLEWAGLPADHVIGVEPVRRRPITAEKVAIAAVMAGCLPRTCRSWSAAIKAMCDAAVRAARLHGEHRRQRAADRRQRAGPPRDRHERDRTTRSPTPAAPTRPSAARSGFSCINVLGCVPGQLDRSTLGHPGKFTFCVAEDEEDSPWLPLAVERGVRRRGLRGDGDGVRVAAPGHERVDARPEEILDTYAAAMRANMLTYSIWEGNYAIVIAKQHRDIFARAGWSKRDIREYIHGSAARARGGLGRGRQGARWSRTRREQEYSALGSPDDLLVIAAGGPAAGFGAILPPWYGDRRSRSPRASASASNC